jgi:hypothetical protein
MKLVFDLKNTYEPDQLNLAISKMNLYRESKELELIDGYDILKKPPKEPEAVKTCDHQPCQDCGNTFFKRTGTCHVCEICGASQGCS